jgi:two-component system alkaline phosphatase synthesis response regulator PhoP
LQNLSFFLNPIIIEKHRGREYMANDKLILVVDDDPDLVEAISMKLESKNYRVAKAYDGIEAWDKIQEERPDLIILDVMMPRKDGYELCDELKNNPKYEDITIVLLTAVGSAVTSTRYTHQGGMTTLADDYIAKPIDLDKLMSMVDDFTGQS